MSKNQPARNKTTKAIKCIYIEPSQEKMDRFLHKFWLSVKAQDEPHGEIVSDMRRFFKIVARSQSKLMSKGVRV